MSGPFVDSPRKKNKSSRSNEIMFAKHLPLRGDLTPPDFVTPRGVLPMFPDPRAGVEDFCGSFLVVLLPSCVQRM